MFSVTLREAKDEDGEFCGMDGCAVMQGDELVVVEVNGTRLIELAADCARQFGGTIQRFGSGARERNGWKR